MSGVLASDEIAEDYKAALEDLFTTDRYQISNLTTIARDNIEHAEAISRTLQNHITRAPPQRKLPALYVLDSIVKNVGTPYTVYFGRNLYQTFMHAYSQVDVAVRRKLEEMLKTWREPVPGSLSTTPVFQLASTQGIVDSLGKLRPGSTAMQARPPSQAPPSARMVQVQSYRNTPTPPHHAIPARPPTVQDFVPAPTPPPQHSAPQLPQPPQALQYTQHYQNPPQLQQHQVYNPPQPYQTHYQQISTPAPSIDIDMHKLHTDIDSLTIDAKIELATHPMEPTAQKRLVTLQTLKEMLDSGSASGNDAVEIRKSIDQQLAQKRVLPPQPPAQMPHQQSYMVPQQQYSQVQPVLHHTQQLQTPAPPPIVNSTNLADLLRATASQNPTPQPGVQQSQYGPPVYVTSTPPIIHTLPAQAAPVENPLIAQLRASGFLSGTSTPSGGMTPSNAGVVEIRFTSASIKTTRPQMVAAFLGERPNQCGTCGRRFTSDDSGKEKKAGHLDWHFKTKARMMEAERRGQNRSWYVDEREWITSKELDEDAPEEKANGASQGVAVKRQQGYVRAPSDPVLRSLPCPIDQEPFHSEWSEEVQDFIWKDAVLVGGRYYHASCYQEVTKDRDKDAGELTPMGAGIQSVTPDSVLGKRKAEQEANGSRLKVKMEA